MQEPQSSYAFSSCRKFEIKDRFSDKNKAQRIIKITFHRERSKGKKKRRKGKKKETLKSVAEEDPAILDYREIPSHGYVKVSLTIIINH